ncbi:MAG: deaminase [Bacilli bacterium]
MKKVISWDEYFMGVALMCALRSKDESCQVGACIVNSKKRIVSTGYNGMPSKCDDEKMPWGKGDTSYLANKHYYVCHAELNAILSSRSDLTDCILYVALYPCNECAKAIIQSGIKEIVYLSDENADKEFYKASKYMLEVAGIKARKLVTELKNITIDFVAKEDKNN